MLLDNEWKTKLEEQLMAEVSRRNTDFVAAWVISHPGAINYLVEISFSSNLKLSFRAAWVLEKLSEKHQGILDEYLPLIIKSLPVITSSSNRRIFSKILLFNNIPRDLEGEVLNFCFSMIENPKEPVAVKANCMTMVFSLLPQYPELKNELFAIIENLIPYNSPAFKARFDVLKKRYFPTKKQKLPYY